MHPSTIPARPLATRQRFVVLALAWLALLGVTAATAPEALAHREDRERAPVTTWGTDDVVGRSVIHRNDRAVRARLHTTGLERGHAHTVWAVVFNDPTACEGPCDAPDLANPDVGGVSLLLDGRVARGRRTTFVGRVSVRDGVTNPAGAEVHLVVRTHGPVIPGLRREQLTTLNGGCPPNDCVNVQSAIHP